MILLDSSRIERTLRRMAYQIVEEAHGAPIQMIGLNERGFSISKVIHPVVEQETGFTIPLHQLHVDADDDFSFDKKPEKNSVLVIIDDVIFSGRTIQQAMDKILERSSFQKIFIAVLVDRGHRNLPIHAEVVGSHIPTKLNEQVDLELIDGKPDRVILKKI